MLIVFHWVYISSRSRALDAEAHLFLHFGGPTAAGPQLDDVTKETERST